MFLVLEKERLHEKANKSLDFFFLLLGLWEILNFSDLAVYLFKYINKTGHKGFHLPRTGNLTHIIDILLDLLVVQAERVLLVEDRVDVLGILAEDYRICMG